MRDPRPTADYVELKKWAFEKVVGWGVAYPAREGKPPEFHAWNFQECMEKADELAKWAFAPPEQEDRS